MNTPCTKEAFMQGEIDSAGSGGRTIKKLTDL